jgi:hypothetical protein
MLQRLRAEAYSEDAAGALQSRADLFGKGDGTRSAEGFELRFLSRLCLLKVLDMLHGSGRTNYFAVRNSPAVLRALEDDEVLSGLIWSNQPSELPQPTEAVVQAEEMGPKPSSLEEEFREAVSDDELKGATLKVLVGMVDSLYYLRSKVEAMDTKLTHLCNELGSSPPEKA